MHVVPFFHRSIYDDIDTLFDDLLWDGQRTLPARRVGGGANGRQGPAENWTAAVQLSGYRPNEVQIEHTKDNSAVKVLARREEGDDYSEARRTIQVPDTVDRNKLQVDFTREGILVLKAPYLGQQQQQQQLATRRGGASFGGALLPREMTQEMRTLENDLWSLANQSFPGSMTSRVEKVEDGSTKLTMDFELSGYKPEEVSVTTDDADGGRVVTVEAKHETKTEHGTSFKHFKRAFTLPANVQAEQLTSRLMADGRLRLEAPCSAKDKEQEQTAAIGAAGQDIPVKRSACKAGEKSK